MIIKELVLLTRDLAGTEEFYNQILEIPVDDKTSTGISFLFGHTVLSFKLTTEANPFYHFAFLIPENKVEEAYEWINKRATILPFTVDTTIADFSNWNAHAFYFHDQQENILEFIAHHDLPNQSRETFTSSSIIGICEIGVPVANVEAACKDFNKRFNIPYFKKGPRMKDFAVMGNDNGLLIVTKTGRGWLPTQRPAEQHYSRVFIENVGVEFELEF